MERKLTALFIVSLVLAVTLPVSAWDGLATFGQLQAEEIKVDEAKQEASPAPAAPAKWTPQRVGLLERFVSHKFSEKHLNVADLFKNGVKMSHNQPKSAPLVAALLQLRAHTSQAPNQLPGSSTSNSASTSTTTTTNNMASIFSKSNSNSNNNNNQNQNSASRGNRGFMPNNASSFTSTPGKAVGVFPGASRAPDNYTPPVNPPESQENYAEQAEDKAFQNLEVNVPSGVPESQQNYYKESRLAQRDD